MPLIKRYSNRKLYDVEKSQYVNLDAIAEMVRRGDEVKVVDYATGADLTAVTLTQVIFEQEKKLGSLLPQAILTRLLRTGNSAIQTLRGGVNAFIDPLQFVDEEIRRRLRQLEDEGIIKADEGGKLAETLTASRMRPTPPVPLTEQSTALEDVDTLRHQVEELEAELGRLQAGK
jgi:polyhydroxyalkanoate synthesis repressor PhaR